MLSYHTLRALEKAQTRDIHQHADQHRLARIAGGTRPNVILFALVSLLRHLFRPASQLGVLEITEDSLYHAEELNLSPEKLRQQEAKRRLYERIAQGNALVEAEEAAHHLRH